MRTAPPTLLARPLLLLLSALFVAASLGGCGTENNDEPARWECGRDTDGWERCDGGRVVWCHGDTQYPHFHNGQRCASNGYACAEVSEKKAVCVDASRSCDASTAACAENTAEQCFNGKLAIQPCGTAKECVIWKGDARCDALPSEECSGHGYVDIATCVCNAGYKQAPDDEMVCIPEDGA